MKLVIIALVTLTVVAFLAIITPRGLRVANDPKVQAAWTKAKKDIKKAASQ